MGTPTAGSFGRLAAWIVMTRDNLTPTDTTAFALVLAQPCQLHDAEPGEPCWTMPADTGHTSPAVCGGRSSLAAERAQQRGKQHGGKRGGRR